MNEGEKNPNTQLNEKTDAEIKKNQQVKHYKLDIFVNLLNLILILSSLRVFWCETNEWMVYRQQQIHNLILKCT